MKRIIRLTERDLTRIVKRVINEQVPLTSLLGAASDTGLSIPNYANDLTVANQNAMKPGCKTYKSYGELTLELFGKLRGIAGQTNQLDKTIQSWILRLNNSMKGVGPSNDLTKVLSEIKTKEQMGSVLNAYNKKFGKTLYQDLKGTDVWGLVKKFRSGIQMDACKERNTQTVSA